ncbi:hypothetical protein V8E53_011951 [Lactarius tabidus]
MIHYLTDLNGVRKVTLATNKGIKMDIAKQLDAADEYIEIARLVEATDVEKLANEAIGYVRRGGTLMIYGVYENKALVHWPPSKIFGDEVRFSQTLCFPRAVTDLVKLKDYQLVLDKMNSRGALKIAIKP